MRDVYKYADKIISNMKKSINAEFHNARNEIGFDALNIIATRDKVSDMFKRMDDRNRRAYKKVFKESYRSSQEDALLAGYPEDKVKHPDLDLDEEIYIVLGDYNDMTEYKYISEVRRKRDRLFESLIAADGDHNRQENSYNRGARLWYDQSSQYTDIMVDEGRVHGLMDAGVEEVIWVSQKDDRVCHECRDLDNQIFPITNIPPKPHRRCRCTIRPVPRT